MMQNYVLTALVAIAGWLFGGVTAGMLPTVWSYREPDSAGTGGTDFAISIYLFILSIVGSVTGTILNLCFFKMGVAFIYILITDMILAALSTSICPKKSRWDAMIACWLSPVGLFYGCVVEPFRKHIYDPPFLKTPPIPKSRPQLLYEELAQAIEKGATEPIASLGANPKEMQSMLLWAAKLNNTEAVRALIQAEAKVDIDQPNGYGVWLHASASGNNEMVDLVLQANAKNKDSLQP